MFLHLSAILFTDPGGSLSGGSLSRGSLSKGSLSKGVSVQGVSIQGVSVRWGSLSGKPPYGKEQAVRILLECFLVYNMFVSRFLPY